MRYEIRIVTDEEYKKANEDPDYIPKERQLHKLLADNGIPCFCKDCSNEKHEEGKA